MFRRALTLAGAGALLALLSGGAATANAAPCDSGLLGGGPSFWDFDDGDGEFDDATLFTTVGFDVERDDAFDGAGVAEVNGNDYSNPDDEACRYPRNDREVLFPADIIDGVVVKPQLYVSARRARGRQFVSLRNTTAAPVTIDFGWDGDLGSDGSTRIAATSSGNLTADQSDRWAATCEDSDGDGCANVADEADRDPELGLNWEGKGSKRHSADVVDVGVANGNFDVEFSDVTIGAGKTVTFLEIFSLAPTIRAAKKAAKAVDKDPRSAGVFAKLSKRELKRLQNWKKPTRRR